MQAIKKEKIHTQGQLKLIYINIFILNSHIAVLYIRLIKETLIIRQENRKIENSCIGFFPSEKTVTIKGDLSENLAINSKIC